MGVFQLTNKVTLGETSNYGPCLTTFNGSLALVWAGTDGEFNLLSSTDGLKWGSKRTLLTALSSSPALGTGGSGLAAPTQLLAFRAQNGNLLVQQVLSDVYGPAGESSEWTDHAPSLSSNYLAWTGAGNPQLNIATCQIDTPDPGAIADVYIYRKTVSSESSDDGPSLCDFNGETFIGWRGSGNYDLNVAQVSGGNIVNKIVSGETSDYRPSLAGVGSNLYMAWTGHGNPDLNVMSSPNGYNSFGGKAVLSDSSGSAPALASYNNALFLAWRGSGNNDLNVARVMGPGL